MRDSRELVVQLVYPLVSRQIDSARATTRAPPTGCTGRVTRMLKERDQRYRGFNFFDDDDQTALGDWRFGNTIDGAQAEYLLVPNAQANHETTRAARHAARDRNASNARPR